MEDFRRPARPASPPWTETELAYFAGILDGEGHLGARLRHNCRTGRPYYDYQVHVANTDVRLTTWLHERFGGTHARTSYAARRNPRAKPLYVWLTASRRGEPVLRAVFPYLKLKQRQAELILELRESIRLGNNQFSEVIWERRAEIDRELRALNRRGRDQN